MRLRIDCLKSAYKNLTEEHHGSQSRERQDDQVMMFLPPCLPQNEKQQNARYSCCNPVEKLQPVLWNAWQAERPAMTGGGRRQGGSNPACQSKYQNGEQGCQQRAKKGKLEV